MKPQPTVQLPGQWSTVAPAVDWMYYFIYWLSVVFFVGITVAAVYFCIKYRRRPGVKTEPTGHEPRARSRMDGRADHPARRALSLRLQGLAPHARAAGERRLRFACRAESGPGTSSTRTVRTRPTSCTCRSTARYLTGVVVCRTFCIRSSCPRSASSRTRPPGFIKRFGSEAVLTPGSTELFCAEYCGRSIQYDASGGAHGFERIGSHARNAARRPFAHAGARDAWKPRPSTTATWTDG